ncbi:MAG: hypothetical protein ACKOYM_08040 [Actinomycetes bacterium]
MKKGRHRRYEEARALKRGPDLDIDALFTDLGGDAPSAPAAEESVSDDDGDDSWEYPDEDDDDEW